MESGNLEKMRIYAYFDSKMEEEVKGSPIEVLINPESYSIEHKLKWSEEQGQGNSGKQLKYEGTEPQDMSFEFLFDSSGIIDKKPREDIVKDLEDLKKILIAFQGESHAPPYIKLVWGSSEGFFKGRLLNLNIQYKLFTADGRPLRAIAKATFKQSIEEEERAARENRSSPDLTHARIVKAGDTLPLMCKRIYGDPAYYYQVAEVNRLDSFRHLLPGTEIMFPPIEKQS